MSTGSPEASVVVPTHNRARLLELTLRSVLWQEDVELELIVVDDGSSDDTADVVAATGDPRVRVLRHDRPLGVSAARNAGIVVARGEWVAFLDDDDLWAPDKLTAQLRQARTDGRGWVYAGEVNVTEDLRLLGGGPPAAPEEVAAELRSANGVPCGSSSVVVRRDLLPAEAFDHGYRHFADWDLWIRLARHGPPSGVRRPMVGYRVHAGNASLDTEGMVAELDIIERRYGGPVDRPRFYRHVARVAQRAGHRRQALKYYMQAAAGDPVYRRRGLLSDVGGIAAGVGRQLRGRAATTLGSPARKAQPTRPRSDTQDAWFAEARSWLERLAADQHREG